MVFVAGSMSELGFSPTFALGASVRSALTAWSAASSLPKSRTGRVVLTIAALTWSGVHVGWIPMTWAATPAAAADAIEVPPMRRYSLETTQLAHIDAKSLPG